MNTIKIYFDTDGSIKELRKDFQLYQGQFHDKLLNVYVPTSVLAPDFTVENEQEQTIADFVASTSVKVGMKYIARNGSIKKSKNYYMNYLKVMTQNGVECAVYERKLPKEFTTYVGQGQTAPVLVVNVVNMDVESNPAEVLSVVTTQECFLDVMPSADLDNDEAVEPSEWELMNAELNAVKETLLEKQDKEDILLQTDAKTVVGAINENKANIGTNATAIGENSTDIAELRNDVINLQALLATGETPIGKMEGTELPTDEELDAYVQSVVDRETAVGDVIIFVLDNTTTYKYTYTADGWQSYEITTVDKASNSTYGVVEGTYIAEEQSAKVRNILADINNGKLENLYVKDGDNYRNLKEFLGANKTAIAEIINGTTPVAEAIRAEQDGEGNNIADTYLTQTAGATKEYVQDYAVPKTFTNVYFISADGYVGEPPAVSETPAFSATTTGAGETEIIKDGDSSDLSMDLTADFDLSISNSYHNTFWVVASENCNVQFRLVTQYKKPTEEWTDLNIELSEEYPLVAGNYERIDFSSQFLSLGSKTVSLGSGDKIRQFLSVIVQVDTPITFGVFSNTVYPSTFNLIAQNYVPAGATSVYVDGSPVATWNANTKTAVTSNGTVLQTFDADTKADASALNDYVTEATTQEISGAKTFTGDNTYKTSGATYGAKMPNTASWTENGTIATVDMIYPVGSVYMSTVSTSPATLFGGTWVQLLDNASIGGGAITIASDGSFNIKGETTGAVASFKFNAVTSSGDSSDAFFYGRSGTSNGYETVKYNSGLKATNEFLVSGIYMWKRTA